LSADPISIGVVSAAPRGIASPRPILGVLLAQSELGARIDEIMPGSGADLAKLQVGDVIVGVNEEEIKSRESLIDRIGQFQAGDIVKLQVRRGEENLKIDATLGPIDDEMSQINRHDFQNHLGGDLSRRRAGFPSVFQHDSVLQPNECGGPVVDLNGHAVGVNIARAGRVASYAIPASVAKEVLASLLNAKPVSIQDGAKMH
jgi:serine protease Do